MKLTHYERKKSNELNDELINQLFQIMDEYYLNTDKNEFFKDLQQKDTILILYDINNIPVGFTTWVTKQFSFSGIQGKYVYSGDTVIKKEASGSLLLPIAWGKSMLSILDSLGENEKLYWLLTTKGFRTYRYLSVFYKEFYPSPIKEIKSLKLSCEYISKELFSNL
ncbi:MAG: hypothetical protein KDK36_21735, partial [Leptospiraceae bacterium]|nr:hypothetical protein [Leptospiraceae bacterium]